MSSRDIREKFRIVFVPSIVCLLSFTLAYTFLVWLLVIKLGWIHLRQTALEVGIPVVAATVIYLLFLKSRFHLFRLKSKKGRDSAHMIVGMGSIAFLMFPAVVVTTYLSKYAYDLVSLTSPTEARYSDNERYYQFSKIYFDPKYTLAYPETHTSGKHNQYLELSYYIICPLLEEKNKYPSGAITHWYGKKYHKQISNRENNATKDALYREFITASEKEWRGDDHSGIIYFERVQPSGDLDNYTNAGSSLTYFSPNSVFFESRYEPFERRLGDNFEWIFISLGLGLLWFAVFSFAPAFSALRIYKYRKKERIADDEFDSFFNYFIPKGDHWVTSILIDINIAWFIIMSLCGVGLLYASVEELIDFGGLGYNEVALGQYWRLVTNMFVHANLVHLVYNMFGLAMGGLFLEKVIGRRKMILAFLVTGIFAAISSLYFSEARVAVGASGAIFGLYGVLLGLLLTKAISNELKATLWIFMGLYVGLSLISGFLSPQTDNAAHLGGLITGVVVGWIFYFFDLLPATDEARVADQADETRITGQ